MKIAEIRSDYIDEQNYCHIDVYQTEDENEQGKTVAIVDMDNGKVYFIDNLYRYVKEVQEAIEEAKKEHLILTPKQLLACFEKHADYRG